MWNQVYNPFNNATLSTIAAALPVVTLLVLIASNKVKAHIAAVIALIVANLVTIFIFTMPADMSLRATVLGAVTGFFPIGWIVLNVIFLYRLTVEKGVFQTLQTTIGGVTEDRRLQLLLIAFCFGAFFEGASGFGTPVAVTAAILIGLGFSPLAASGLSLIANTAPVAYGALGTPIAGLAERHRHRSVPARRHGRTAIAVLLADRAVLADLGLRRLERHEGHLAGDPGHRRLLRDPAIPDLQLRQSVDRRYRRFAGLDGLPDPVPQGLEAEGDLDLAGAAQPRRFRGHDGRKRRSSTKPKPTTAQVWFSLMPWIIVCVILLLWGTNYIKAILNAYATWNYAVPGLHNMINKVAPIVPVPTKEGAVFSFTWLSYTGSGMLISAIISGFLMGFSPVKLVVEYGKTIKICAYSLLTISAMLAIGTLTRLSGVDATLGLAFAGTGVLYPFFGTLLGWLGVALTGSDTSSNILFGNLQKITATQLGISPILMAAANSSGGVMGKMIDAQSIVVASTATNWFGHEGTILRFVFKHSIALACLVGILVMLQAYVFTGMIVK